MKETPSGQPQPMQDASLIMTVYNEGDSIRGFLDTLSDQTVLPREIVIVDGGSSDGTVDAIRRWTAPAGVDLVVEVCPGANISTGRNRAIRAASHDLILVTDAGTTLSPRWVEAISAPFAASSPPDVVSGFFSPRGESFVQRVIAFTITPLLDEIDPASFLPSSRSVAFRKSAWADAGGYPEWLDYCEDLVFDLAMKSNGVHMSFAPDAEVTWSARPDLRAFMVQYYRYARGDGKADLWLKRHLARYSAYAVGVGLLGASRRQPLLLVPLAGGVLGYFAKFFRRVARRRADLDGSLPTALALVPVIVVAGDIAKMAGYPVGTTWRLRGRRDA